MNASTDKRLVRAEFAIVTKQIELVERVLGAVPLCDDDYSRDRTAVHEAGHALVALVLGVDFAFALVDEGGRTGCVSNEGLVIRTVAAPVESRIAIGLGGALAELLTFDDVGPAGVEQDLRVALARAAAWPEVALLLGDEVDGEGGDPADEATRVVREQVEVIETMLRRRKRTLLALAHALSSAGRLTRHECVRAARAAGSRVRVRPRHSPICHPLERRACDEAVAAIEERDAKLRRLQRKVLSKTALGALGA